MSTIETKTQDTGGDSTLTILCRLVPALQHDDAYHRINQTKRNRLIAIIERRVVSLEHKKGNLLGLVLDNNSICQINTLYARPTFEQHCCIPGCLGCNLNNQGLLIVDGNQKTNIPGIYACGDNSAFRSVAVAVSTGNQAGAAINSALCIEQFNL